MSKFIRAQLLGRNTIYSGRYKKGKVTLDPLGSIPLGAQISGFQRHGLTGTPLTLLRKDFKTYRIPAVRGHMKGWVLGKDFHIAMVKDLNQGSQICHVESPLTGKHMLSSPGVCATITSTGANPLIKVNKRALRVPGQSLCLVGVIAGADKALKPILKAGTASKMTRARGKKYPTVSANKMNVSQHPLGGKSKSNRGTPMTKSRHAPPGAKYGCNAARRTGKK